MQLCHKCKLPRTSWGEGRIIFTGTHYWHDGCWTDHVNKGRKDKDRIIWARKIYLTIINPANVFKYV